jgi:adenylate kinase family enzyme
MQPSGDRFGPGLATDLPSQPIAASLGERRSDRLEPVGRARKSSVEFFPRCVALSGPVCAGKTTLAEGLVERLGAQRLATRALIAAAVGQTPEALGRAQLQCLGDRLDREVGGEWAREGVAGWLRLLGPQGLLVVDSVRTRDQVEAIRRTVPTIHIHLTAPDDVLSARYEGRRQRAPSYELSSFAALRSNKTEEAVDHLSTIADIELNTAVLSIADTRSRAITALRTRGSPSER